MAVESADLINVHVVILQALKNRCEDAESIFDWLHDVSSIVGLTNTSHLTIDFLSISLKSSFLRF